MLLLNRHFLLFFCNKTLSFCSSKGHGNLVIWTPVVFMNNIFSHFNNFMITRWSDCIQTGKLHCKRGCTSLYFKCWQTVFCTPLTTIMHFILFLSYPFWIVIFEQLAGYLQGEVMIICYLNNKFSMWKEKSGIPSQTLKKYINSQNS